MIFPVGRSSLVGNLFLARVAALALSLTFLWLTQQAGRVGIAGIYGASAAEYQSQLRNDRFNATLAHDGERKITVARSYAAGHADYALQAANLTAAMGDSGIALPILREGLADNPVRADLWARLALYSYEVDGVTPNTVHALDQALRLGPREYDTHLVNATIVLGAGAQLDVERRVRGWNIMLEAVAMPQLSGQIMDMVKAAGMERQLQALIRENSRARAALDKQESSQVRRAR